MLNIARGDDAFNGMDAGDRRSAEPGHLTRLPLAQQRRAQGQGAAAEACVSRPADTDDPRPRIDGDDP
jgi:hypothetical protein